MSRFHNRFEFNVPEDIDTYPSIGFPVFSTLNSTAMVK